MIDPMTPPECDLRGMPFMPVDLVRLFDSDVYALSSGDEFKAAFTLWGKAFLQVPAGSLPTDDRILAHLSGAGSRWSKVKDMALRGWVECSDGRLYHAVVSEKAREAWAARLAQRARTEAARAARAAKRQDSDSSNTPPTTQPVTNQVTHTVATYVTETVTGSKGQGQGQGQLREEERTPSPPSVGRPPSGARLPADWSPGVEEVGFAESLGLDPVAVTARFRDYWCAKPGKDGRKSDWSATWRNWCRRDAEKPRAMAARPGKLDWLWDEMRAEADAGQPIPVARMIQ